jgi:hypothetical protein
MEFVNNGGNGAFIGGIASVFGTGNNVYNGAEQINSPIGKYIFTTLETFSIYCLRAPSRPIT